MKQKLQQNSQLCMHPESLDDSTVGQVMERGGEEEAGNTKDMKGEQEQEIITTDLRFESQSSCQRELLDRHHLHDDDDQASEQAEQEAKVDQA